MKLSQFKMTTMALVLSVMTVSMALTGCGGGGGSSDPYFEPWYDVYGFKCGSGTPEPGCNYYKNGLKIIDLEDPYFKNYYDLTYDTWYYYDSYGFARSYTGWAWESPTGIIYDDWGDALNSQDGRGRDFMGDVAQAEANAVKSAGEAFAAKYHLDAEVGVQVAQALNDWAVLGKDRARTEADIADFTKRLYGVDFNKVKNALAEAQKGNTANLEAAVNEAAANWSTTPETMKEILKGWYGNQINQ